MQWRRPYPDASPASGGHGHPDLCADRNARSRTNGDAGPGAYGNTDAHACADCDANTCAGADCNGNPNP